MNMSIKKNKELILHMYDLYNKGETDRYYDEGCAPECIWHDTLAGEQNINYYKQVSKMAIAVFPDRQVTVSNLIGERDMVAFQETLRGTHKGVFMGAAPTNNKIQIVNTNIVRIRNDKIVEWWGTFDMLNLLQQIGIIAKR
jgi:predicted ester cyclase